MLIPPASILRQEARIVETIPGILSKLKFARMHLVCDVSNRPNEIGREAVPWSIVVAYAAHRVPCGQRRWHRVLTLNCADLKHLDGADDDGSDNLCLPLSFVAGEPLTTAPTAFGLKTGGPEGTFRRELRHLLDHYRGRWESYYRALGIPPLTSSVERLSVDTIPHY